ncbi:hypothetical protein ACFL2V_11290 [Pseudomonadota bacterium]
MKKPEAFECTLGFDAKINRNGHPFIIEINGKNSGLEGLEHLESIDLGYARNELMRNLEGRVNSEPKMEILDSQEALASGRTEIAHKSEKVAIFTIEPEPPTITTEIHGVTQEFVIHRSAAGCSALTDNKLAQKKYIDPTHTAPFTVWDGNRSTLDNFLSHLVRDHNQMIDWDDYPYLVVKSVAGSSGSCVSVLPVFDMKRILRSLQTYAPSKALLEAFVESRTIDGHEDGCMRYLVDFMVFLDGQGPAVWRPIYEGAYWRISPGGTDEGDLNKRFKANFSGEHQAIPHTANEPDTQLIRRVVHETVNNIVADVELFQAA